MSPQKKKTKKQPSKVLTKLTKKRDLPGGIFFTVAIIGILFFLAYANSLNGTWAMDDIVVKKSVEIRNINDFIGFRKIASLTLEDENEVIGETKGMDSVVVLTLMGDAYRRNGSRDSSLQIKRRRR